MKLKDFIKEFDRDNSIVLLEGKRKVREEDKEKLVTLGRMLALKTEKITFRSGNAGGADQYFSEGVSSVDPIRLQVITPYSGHREKSNKAYETFSLDDIDLAREPELVYQSKNNKKTEKLIDKYVAGDRNKFAIKAAYIIRDTVKVLGADGILPASFGLFYDDLEDPLAGGTGHTMQVCVHNKIPLLDQQTWFNWLKE